MRLKKGVKKEMIKKFGSVNPPLCIVCSVCGEEAGKHCGPLCPKDIPIEYR